MKATKVTGGPGSTLAGKNVYSYGSFDISVMGGGATSPTKGKNV